MRRTPDDPRFTLLEGAREGLQPGTGSKVLPPLAMLDPRPESYGHAAGIAAMLARHDRERAATPGRARGPYGPGWRPVGGEPMYSAAWL